MQISASPSIPPRPIPQALPHLCSLLPTSSLVDPIHLCLLTSSLHSTPFCFIQFPNSSSTLWYPKGYSCKDGVRPTEDLHPSFHSPMSNFSVSCQPLQQNTYCSLNPHLISSGSHRASLSNLPYPSPQLQQRHPKNTQDTPAREADRLTADLYFPLHASKSSPPVL